VPGILAAPDLQKTPGDFDNPPFRSDYDHPTIFWIMNAWNTFTDNMAVGAGAFWAGRANRTPYVEATLPPQTGVVETTLTAPDAPFHDRDEDAAQIQALSPEEMKALLKQLNAPPTSPR
jgi:hypothetical protein